MLMTFRNNVTLNVSNTAPNVVIESVGINHFQIAMGVVRALKDNNDVRVLMYYPENCEQWNDLYSDFFHTTKNVSCDVQDQIHFNDLVNALIEIGTFRWAKICDVPKDMVLVVPYAEQVLDDADMELFSNLLEHCSSIGVHVVLISDWRQRSVDLQKLVLHNKFVTSGECTRTSLQIIGTEISQSCEFYNIDVAVEDGSPTYTRHIFLDVEE